MGAGSVLQASSWHLWLFNVLMIRDIFSAYREIFDMGNPFIVDMNNRPVGYLSLGRNDKQYRYGLLNEGRFSGLTQDPRD